jgi:hypothetical protein
VLLSFMLVCPGWRAVARPDLAAPVERWI